MTGAFITGLAGATLSAEERAFLRDADPWGLILFKRNIETPDQVLRLVAKHARARSATTCPVLIDQEGGRVQRLGPPHWPNYPPGAAYGALYDATAPRACAAARLGARLIADDLTAARHRRRLPAARRRAGRRGRPGDRRPRLRHDAGEGRGDRRGRRRRPDGGGRAAGAQAHSRAMAARPPTAIIACRWSRRTRSQLEATDFAAFRPLAQLPLGMTAHVVFTSLDPSRRPPLRPQWCAK